MARHIFASASSSWPTPNAAHADHDTSLTKSGDGREKPNKLGWAVANWPTPDAGVRQGFNRSESEGAANRPLLAEAAKNWPTARAEDMEGALNHPGAIDSLTGAIRQWQTPSVADLAGGHATRGGARSKEELLAGQAKNWPTPNTPSGGPKTKSTKTHTGGVDLDGALVNWSTRWPTPESADSHRSSIAHVRGNPTLLGASASFPPGELTTSDGEPSSPRVPSSPLQLNPTFVEWLMGWPIGWTVPGSPLPATEWSRWLRHMHSSLYTLGWEVVAK